MNIQVTEEQIKLNAQRQVKKIVIKTFGSEGAWRVRVAGIFHCGKEFNLLGIGAKKEIALNNVFEKYRKLEKVYAPKGQSGTPRVLPESLWG